MADTGKWGISYSQREYQRSGTTSCGQLLFIAGWLSFALLIGVPATCQTTTIFSNDRIGFADGQSREIRQTITFPVFSPDDQIRFNWDILADQDPWDRAGSIHAILPDGKQVQLGKFATGFRGTTTHQQDISDLAPLLSGQTLEVEAFIDTWVADAWNLNASVTVLPGGGNGTTWAAPVISRDGGLGWHDSGDVLKRYIVGVPDNLQRTKLTYFASGHHHNQTNASDEFNQRRHRLYVDNVEVWTGIPWRTDGPNFRSVNPTSGRWDGNGDGDTNDPYPTDYWSSDFPRSGWIPGDEVTPFEIDVTDYLTPGRRHRVDLLIEGIDINSYWRVSAYASGVAAPLPDLQGDFNLDGTVDAADYTVWRDSVGLTGSFMAADANMDAVIDSLDYDLWRQNYGQSSSQSSSTSNSASHSVPEPTTLSLIASFLMASRVWQREKRCRYRR